MDFGDTLSWPFIIAVVFMRPGHVNYIGSHLVHLVHLVSDFKPHARYLVRPRNHMLGQVPGTHQSICMNGLYMGVVYGSGWLGNKEKGSSKLDLCRRFVTRDKAGDKREDSSWIRFQELPGHSP